LNQLPGYELDKIMFRVKKDKIFRENFLSDFDRTCKDFNLTEEERESLKLRNYSKLAELGLKPELVMALADIDKSRKK
jgi:hypothetical protein